VDSALEVVRGRPGRFDLAVRLAAGQALELLALYRQQRTLGSDERKTLAWALDVLRPTADTGQNEGQSLADYKRQLRLVVAAQGTIPAESIEPLLDRLKLATSRLDALVAGRDLPDVELADLEEALSELRRALATSRPLISEEPPKRSRA